jgi:Questin oxidase-like
MNRYTHEVPYGWTLEPAHKHTGQPIAAEGFKALLGQKKNYPELVEFFDRELKQLGQRGVLEKYVPVLVPGIASALTHGIIHLGWALDFGSRTMLIEGIQRFSALFFV